MIEQGTGSPVVVVPGIQGRWEWMAPALAALARRHRVFTFSLSDATGPDLFRDWIGIIDRLVAKTEGRQAALVGVSFGGLVAACYAAEYPDRVASLVLVSAPSPTFQLDHQSAGYVRRPRLSMPLFAGRAALRLAPELAAGLPGVTARARFAVEHLARVVRFPASPPHMARCVRAWQEADLTTAVGRIAAPTLIMTGEPRLDRVVPVSNTLEYLSLVPNARHLTLDRTGHLGLVVRPRAFAAAVTDFIDAADRSRAGRSA